VGEGKKREEKENFPAPLTSIFLFDSIKSPGERRGRVLGKTKEERRKEKRSASSGFSHPLLRRGEGNQKSSFGMRKGEEGGEGD